jgi:hypothetical protein
MFWDVTRCSPIEVHRSFEVTYGLNLEGKRSEVPTLSLKDAAVYLAETSVNFYRLYGVASQKKVFFIYSFVHDSVYLDPIFMNVIKILYLKN